MRSVVRCSGTYQSTLIPVTISMIRHGHGNTAWVVRCQTRKGADLMINWFPGVERQIQLIQEDLLTATTRYLGRFFIHRVPTGTDGSLMVSTHHSPSGEGSRDQGKASAEDWKRARCARNRCMKSLILNAYAFYHWLKASARMSIDPIRSSFSLPESHRSSSPKFSEQSAARPDYSVLSGSAWERISETTILTRQFSDRLTL
ncbi:hypothetical protein F5B22DRAFT_350969 [Xylaria bambusicola]|uniref:uncharacterized protein n=1 Tax=Xylaria bambusicola TaxID=326684 RepID=UPI0020086F40|nr:uncharacterized protein F5B22DRAFT_350969 [Xylaria bambusicola]KAI0525598.1 hypothetical protein F5B22DRAFT_350969 [Xylaria bambusicola]